MPVLQETVSSVTVAAVEVSTTVTLDDGDTLVEVTMTETSITVTQADVSVVMQTEVGMPILVLVPGPPQGLEPWTQLTVIESPELTPIIAQDKYRYAVGVLFPSDHDGPGYPAEPSIVAIELPLAPYDGYEFSWMDRDNGFAEDTCFWIKPAAGSTYTIDGFPAGDGLVIDVMDYNNGLAYCALTDSWNMVFARTELVGFGKVLIKGQFQAHLGIPVAAVDGEFWEATTAGTVLGSTIKVDDVCVFRENKTTVNVIPRITAADEASTAMTTAVALAASGAAGLYVPLAQRNANNGVATLDDIGQVQQLIPAANVVETTGERLVSDAEKAAWNGTLAAANGYTDSEITAQSGLDRQYTDDTVSGAVALYVPLTQRNANNGVATLGATGELVQSVPAANVVETSGKRLVSDVEKAAWNAKLDASAYNEHYRGKFASLVALQTAIPAGSNGNTAIVDPGTGVAAVEYLWDSEEGWVQTGNVAASTTDGLSEGSLNLYHTPGRAVAAALAGLLSGISFATSTAITAADSLLSALGKLQAQITVVIASLASHTGNTSNPHSVTAAQAGADALGTAAAAIAAHEAAITTLRTVSTSGLVVADDTHIIVTGTGVVMTMMPAATVTGKTFRFKCETAAGFEILPNGAELIDGAASLTIMFIRTSLSLTSDGSNWIIG